MKCNTRVLMRCVCYNHGCRAAQTSLNTPFLNISIKVKPLQGTLSVVTCGFNDNSLLFDNTQIVLVKLNVKPCLLKFKYNYSGSKLRIMNINGLYRIMRQRLSGDMIHMITFLYRTTFLNFYKMCIECYYAHCIDTIVQGLPITLAPVYSVSTVNTIRGRFQVKTVLIIFGIICLSACASTACGFRLMSVQSQYMIYTTDYGRYASS